jgi:hypothetical protein
VRRWLPELKEDYDALMARAAAVRGRALLYPYLGSGVGNARPGGTRRRQREVGHDLRHRRQLLLATPTPTSPVPRSKPAIDDVNKHGNLLEQLRGLRLRRDAPQGGRPPQPPQARLRRHQRRDGQRERPQGLHAEDRRHPRAGLQGLLHGPQFIAMLAVGDSHVGREGLPINTHVDYMPFYDHVAAERMGKTRFIDMCLWHLDQYVTRYPGQHACFIFELVQGEGGFNWATATTSRR